MQERLTGAVVGAHDFATAVRRVTARGAAFRGFPISFNHISPARILATLVNTPVCRDILHVRGGALAAGCALVQRV